MKNIITKTIDKIIAVILAMVVFVACNDEFMERFPETAISPEAFFKTVKDLELYTNTYYTTLQPEFLDYISDNNAAFSTTLYAVPATNLIRGDINVENVTGWSRDEWGTLRKYNLFLENVSKATGDQAAINHYIGLTRMQRAIWYYTYVKRYSDVPWYSESLTEVDEELLYKTRDPRTLVVDNIMADLQYAVDNMSGDVNSRTQFSRWYAAAMMARICLHEGTFRKYHPELNLQSTANSFLNKAVEAAEIVMNSGNFEIDKTGGTDNEYRSLFSSMDLSKSREMILFKEYSNDMGIRHEAGFRTSESAVVGYSRNLMEDYQYITSDGKAVPFNSLPGYDKMPYAQVFENRDPRFSQTFMPPGYIRPGTTQPYRPNLTAGGYYSIKYMPSTVEQFGGQQHTDMSLFRYAEILLIYAEAKAEMGTITQEDLDKSVNLIRDRVEMPPTIIGNIVEDATLKAQFPEVTDYLILEIRRERRIELVYEQFRWDDLFRWKAGHLFTNLQEGIYVEQLGLLDLNGDGKPTVGLFESVATNTVPEAERANYSFYYLKDAAGNPGVISLTNGTSGHIIINSEVGHRTFDDPKFYYLPIPQQQTILNPNLEQTMFWK